MIARFKLSDWSEDQTCTTKPDLCTSTTNQYIKSYFILIMMYVLFTILRIFSFIPGRIRAARILHHDLANAVMDAPVSFHDITPVGRVLNRFNKDMFTVDYDLPDSLTMLLLQFFFILAECVIIIISTRGLMAIVIIIAFISG